MTEEFKFVQNDIMKVSVRSIQLSWGRQIFNGVYLTNIRLRKQLPHEVANKRKEIHIIY